jgi:phenylacetate-CoA ligase
VKRTFYNEVRGIVGSVAVFPVAERLEKRKIRARQAALAVEMSRPFAERRRVSWNRLVDTVRFAGANVPYYRDLFRSISFDPERLTRDAGYLAEIPLLTKDIVREQGERLLRDDHAKLGKHVCKTGGSTGPSTNIIYDQRGADWSSAVTRYARSLVGAGAPQPELHFAANFGEVVPVRARVREQIKCLANNRFNVTFSTFAPEELDGIWRRIQAIKPYLVHGHPSTLHQLAVHLEARGVRQRLFEVFESSGEILGAAQREVIARVFGCRVVNRYGLAEAGVVAYQADPDQDDMIVFDPVAWPEIVDVEFGADIPQQADRRNGELVLTALTNRMMPLIRYRTGDIASLRETQRGFQLETVMGRVHDVIDVGGIPVPTHHVQDVLDRIGGVREFQIESGQNRPTLRIVPESLAARKAIEHGLKRRWKNSIDVEFVGLDALKRQGWRSKFRHLVLPDR